MGLSVGRTLNFSRPRNPSAASKLTLQFAYHFNSNTNNDSLATDTCSRSLNHVVPSPRPNHSGEVHPLLETHAAVPLTQQPPTSHRVSRWGVLAVTSTLLFGAAVFGVFKPSPSTLRSVTTVAPDAKFDLFTPIFNAEVPPESLFNHTDAHKTLLPPKYLAPGLVGSRPIPTNDWWGNMIGATAEEDVVYPVWTNPYSVTPSIYMEPFGLTMNYPFTTREFGGGLTGNGDAEMYYLHGQVPEFTFSATEFSNASHPVFEVFDWDDLSVQLRFMDRRDNSKKFEATLASGMAFVTVHYSGLTPRFQTVYNISTINGLDATESINRPLTNTRYVLQFDNGATWTLYFSTQVSLYFDGHSTLDMKQPFTGVSRVALIPDASAQEQRSLTTRRAACSTVAEWRPTTRTRTRTSGRPAATVPPAECCTTRRCTTSTLWTADTLWRLRESLLTPRRADSCRAW